VSSNCCQKQIYQKGKKRREMRRTSKGKNRKNGSERKRKEIGK
jgi:hypothetical protein